ncbi:MAG: AIR synthase family protein [Nitrospirota bacterium]|nr:AIR synthase family protein [Nitrospirota bacterium]
MGSSHFTNSTSLTPALPPGRGGRSLPIGKLPVTLLRTMLARYARNRDPRVIVGAGIGLDAAALDIGGQYVMIKTDPVTFVTEEIGAYALAINANDLATMGARPRWFLATMLLPAGTTTSAGVSRIFSQIGRACRRLKISLCGGHTEVTAAVTRPVVVGCLLGQCPKNRLITTAGARVGDAVLLTKGIPIEAVSILAREKSKELQHRYSARFVARCRRYFTDPGVTIVRDATIALAVGGVHAMHDPTEGGLSAALYELAEAARVGVQVDERAIPILPEGRRLCDDFGMNPLGAIASGALIICADPSRAQAILRRLTRSGIAATQIGTIVPARKGVTFVTDGRRVRPVPRFPVDEMTRVLNPSYRPSR